VFTVNEILDIAIRLERNGEAVYRQAIEKVSIPEIESMLEWMANEEVLHARWFSDLKNKASDQAVGISAEKIGPDLLNGVIGEQSFSLQGIDFTNIAQLSDLMNVFIEFENDGILFYEMLLPFVRSDSTRELLEKIITEERQHIKTLREKIVELAETSTNS